VVDQDKGLFLDSLTVGQRKRFDEDQTIVVEGSDGNKYVINCQGSYVGNVWWCGDLEDLPSLEAVKNNPALVKSVFCCYPGNATSVWAGWLGQKLAIETNEAYFLRKAITGSIKPPPRRKVAS
jgi:hypothetical protein